jgi:ribosomal protein S27E
MFYGQESMDERNSPVSELRLGHRSRRCPTAKLKCPNCGASSANPDGWAKAAIATLMSSPAIPDMATQVRCQECQHLFTQFYGGQSAGWRALWPAVILIALLVAVAVLLPG